MWGKLVSCPYCLSHWIGGLFVAISPDLRHILPHTNAFVAWVLISFSVVGLCAVLDVMLDLRSRFK